MKSLLFTAALCGLAASATPASAQSFAPASLIGNTVLNGTLTGSTGGANGDGTFSDLLSVNGMDYTLSTSNTLSSPVPFTYASSGPNTGVLTEGSLSVTLTFASASGGTFAADYGGGVTQSGTFTLTSLGVPTALNALVQSTSLYNASNLVRLDAGTSTTVGFVIGGSTPLTVLVRASGPALAQFGVTGALATPVLALTDAKGNPIASNSGWNNSSALQTAFGEAGAFNFPAGSADSAVVVTLPPGAYTAQVRGGSASDSGYTLVEVFVVN